MFVTFAGLLYFVPVVTPHLPEHTSCFSILNTFEASTERNQHFPPPASPASSLYTPTDLPLSNSDTTAFLRLPLSARRRTFLSRPRHPVTPPPTSAKFPPPPSLCTPTVLSVVRALLHTCATFVCSIYSDLPGLTPTVSLKRPPQSPKPTFHFPFCWPLCVLLNSDPFPKPEAASTLAYVGVAAFSSTQSAASQARRCSDQVTIPLFPSPSFMICTLILHQRESHIRFTHENYKRTNDLHHYMLQNLLNHAHIKRR